MACQADFEGQDEREKAEPVEGNVSTEMASLESFEKGVMQVTCTQSEDNGGFRAS